MDVIYNHEVLTNAIIIQAANDYRAALRIINPTSADRWEKIKLQRFFRSDWFKMLTKVDGEMIMQRLKDEVNNGA